MTPTTQEEPIASATTNRKSRKSERPSLASAAPFAPPIRKNIPDDDDDDLSKYLPDTGNKPVEESGEPVSAKAQSEEYAVLPGQMEVTREAKAGAVKNLSGAAKAVRQSNSANKDAKRTSLDWPEGLGEKIKIICAFRGQPSMKDYLISLVLADIETLPPAMKSVLDLMDEQVKKDRKEKKIRR